MNSFTRSPRSAETSNQLRSQMRFRVNASSSLPPPDPAAQTSLANNVYLPQLVDPVLLKQTPPESAVAQFRKDATALLAAP